jgi:hypothetical protein
MKYRIAAILAIAAIYLTSCQKEATVDPNTDTTQGTQQLPPTSIGLNRDSAGVTTTGSAIDTTKGYFCVKLDKDSVNTDGIMIEFNPAAKAAYSGAEDARFLQGFGSVSLSSLSSDNIALSINTVPLVASGTTVRLVVNATSTGTYKLNLTKISTISAKYDIWLKDKYLKDSLDFRHNPAYLFDLTADTNSYGSHRFSIVTRLHQ